MSAPAEPAPPVEAAVPAEPLLQVNGLTKLFALPRRWPRRRRFARAVDDVSLHLYRGETLGVVGETGSGKSTLARCILRLTPIDFGQILFGGVDLTGLDERGLRGVRRQLQPVFQDPHRSLDPNLTVQRVIAEGVLAHPGPQGSPNERALGWMSRVGLDPELGGRRPDQLSAGERQRVAVARALAAGPKLVVCDEPLTALDVSVRAQIVNLLLDLQSQLGLSYLFISHDLRMVRYVSHRVAVMYLGRIVETGPASAVYETALHPYTRALIGAIPGPDPTRRPLRLLLEGAAPEPGALPHGCAFHPRCPRRVEGICDRTAPTLVERTAGSGHHVACHFPLDAPPGETNVLNG